jgi:hypothetical protein
MVRAAHRPRLLLLLLVVVRCCCQVPAESVCWHHPSLIATVHTAQQQQNTHMHPVVVD